MRCFNNIRHVLEERGNVYANTYGIKPKFRAALHMGTVVAGEMGLVKQAIVYLGDTMNTTARIEAACKELDADILISAEIVDRLAGVTGCDFVGTDRTARSIRAGKALQSGGVTGAAIGKIAPFAV